MNNIPIIGAKQEQPVFPATQINVTPQGWIINIHLAPNLTLTTAISRDDVTNLIGLHKTMLGQERMALHVAKHAVETKL